ncbi:amidase [Epidermidibacterium keratini]|uniref:Amidase n=1 Tax=Epidermidibacterium keratini TaxID=1891644 RepID=A0A7L4YLG9_9ACTN|nr:amidase [Epidermidibacterium keratini]QHB99396.1 amidase [Epidermidibacterium keratini]
MGQLHELSALEQAAAIKARRVSPVELVTHYLERIERHNDEVGAFATVTADAALEQARVAEQHVMAGDRLPLLHGVPTAIKDLSNIAGVRTTFGSGVFRDFVAEQTDEAVEKLLSGGAISLGKTQTPEFGFPCWTINDVGPTARTPWDTSRLASGSSGGSATAVASGLVSIAQGSDGGGSVRSPASACGVVGLKTSRGRITNGPLRVDPAGLGVWGPLARTVRDAAAFLDVTAGPGRSDPYWAPPLRDDATFLAACAREPGRLRIARYADPVVPGAELAPEVRAAWEQTSQLLESLGHRIEDIPAPYGPEAMDSFVGVWTLGATTLPVPDEQIGQLAPLTRWLREQGLRLSGQQAMQSLVATGQTGRRVLETLLPYDAVLCPVTTDVARPVDWYGDDPAEDFERQKRYSAYTSIYNVTGQPAMSLPTHHSSDGLPIGMMLVGRPAGEEALLSLASQVEAHLPWRDRKPPIWSR